MQNKICVDPVEYNRAHRLVLPVWGPVLLALFGVWQMGVVFYSSTALSLHGRTPLPVSVKNATLLIVAGYVASLVTLLFAQKKCVLLGRVCLALSLACALGLFLPLPQPVLAWLIYGQDFLCVFFIGVSLTVSITLLRVEQTLLYALFGSILAGIFLPLMQNDLFSVPFAAFNGLTCCILVCLLTVYFRLPATAQVEYPGVERMQKTAARLTGGVYCMVTVSCLMTLFGASLAEGAPNGVAVYYLSGGACAALFLILWKKTKRNPLRMATAFLMLGGLGFLLFIVSAAYPALRYCACALTGGGLIVCNLIEFFAAGLFVQRPSRLVVPAVVGIALATVVFHSLLLELFRGDPAALSVIYGGVAVVGTALYLRMEPYLAYAWDREGQKHLPPQGKTQPDSHPGEEAAARESCPAAFEELTPQEQAVADLILRGYTGKEISERMNISINTQKDYRKNIYAKLQIHSRSELFELAGEKNTKSI